MLLGPCLSFSSSKFKTDIKAVWSKYLFFVRKNVLLRPKNYFQTIFIFLLFLNVFWSIFSFLCSLAVLVVSQQVLNDLNRFGRVQSKSVFYDEHFLLAAWS